MKYRVVTTADAKNNLSRLLDGVASNDETIYITRNGRPIAQISRVSPEFAAQYAGTASMILGGPQTEGIIRLGTGWREFRVSAKEAEALAMRYGQRHEPGIRLQTAGGEVTFPPSSVESISVPRIAKRSYSGEPTSAFAELITIFDTRYRLTQHDYESISANLQSGSPIFSFQAVDNNGVAQDRVIFMPRESIGYVHRGES